MDPSTFKMSIEEYRNFILSRFHSRKVMINEAINILRNIQREVKYSDMEYKDEILYHLNNNIIYIRELHIEKHRLNFQNKRDREIIDAMYNPFFFDYIKLYVSRPRRW